MNILPWIGIAALTVASLAALHRMVSGGESRWGLLSALLALLAAQLTFEFVLDPNQPALDPNQPTSLPLETLSGLALAATCVLGFLVAYAYARTATERDRAETLHWESMEMVRGLIDLRQCLRSDTELDEALERILDLARMRLGVEVGLVTRVRADRWEVIAARCPQNLDLCRGTVLPLSDTFCERVFATGRCLTYSSADAAVWTDHPAKLALGFGSYLGAPVHVDGKRFGTLCFASSEAIRKTFSATQRDLVGLLAEWVGLEIDRAVGNRIAASETAADRLLDLEPGILGPDTVEVFPGLDIEFEPAKSAGPLHKLESSTSHSERPAYDSGSGLDVNAAIEKMKDLLTRCVGGKIKLTLNLANNLRPVRAPAIAFRQLVLSIVRHAVASMPAGGELELETAYVGPVESTNRSRQEGEPGPSGFVTLAIHDTGGNLEVDQLGAHFETAPPIKADDPTARSAGAVISLDEVERILRSGGGDLSLEVEPGLGTTYTVFLPEAPPDIPAAAEPKPPEPTRSAVAITEPAGAAEAPRSNVQLSFLA